MAKFDLTASSRYTGAAILLENFLDDNTENIPPALFEGLNDLAGEIETIEESHQTEIEELKNEKTDLEKRIEELENELEAKE